MFVEQANFHVPGVLVVINTDDKAVTDGFGTNKKASGGVCSLTDAQRADMIFSRKPLKYTKITVKSFQTVSLF